MITNHEFGIARQQRKSFISIRLRFLSVLIFLGLFTISPCYGQMGSSAIYSDTWLDDSGVDSERVYEEGESVPGAHVVSWGVSQDNNNVYNHRYWVRTKLTGPDGRTATLTSGSSSSYARAEVTLPFTFNASELGDFTTESIHFLSCPYMYGATPTSSTFDLIRIGLSQACYYKGGTSVGIDIFYRVTGCEAAVSCFGPSSYPLPAIIEASDHMLRLETWFSAAGYQRACTGRFALFNAPRGCTRAACRDFPPMQ